MKSKEKPLSPLVSAESTSLESLALTYKNVRGATEALCRPLAIEDYVIQSMPETSPVKWHLAHTTWFFETFVLKAANSSYKPYQPRYDFLFNSYYKAAGPMHSRPKRGLLSRPSIEEIFTYRKEIDDRILAFLASSQKQERQALLEIILLGINHEQQHQELILTDLLHLFAQNPLRPAYHKTDSAMAKKSISRPQLEWWTHPEGLYLIGQDGKGFAYDNEGPRHKQYISEFSLGTRLVTCAEYLQFMEDQGYARPELWLADGFDLASKEMWQAPLYWEKHEGRWFTMSLSGMREVAPDEPVCHVSYYEANAYANWAGSRLPTEAEWEVVASEMPPKGNFAENKWYQAQAATGASEPCDQMFGDVWEWTSSAYSPYPGFRPLHGALGEYNGKFMCNQFVLRGGSCATAKSHIRATYRNFFAPHSRWQFSGIRLAKDVL